MKNHLHINEKHRGLSSPFPYETKYFITWTFKFTKSKKCQNGYNITLWNIDNFSFTNYSNGKLKLERFFLFSFILREISTALYTILKSTVLLVTRFLLETLKVNCCSLSFNCELLVRRTYYVTMCAKARVISGKSQFCWKKKFAIAKPLSKVAVPFEVHNVVWKMKKILKVFLVTFISFLYVHSVAAVVSHYICNIIT